MNENNIYRLDRGKTNKGNIKWKPGQKEKIVELYTQGNSITQLKKKFGGLHYNTTTRILKEAGIELRTRSQSKMTYQKNSSIFKNITSKEQAYWLGVLAADGFIGREADGSGANVIKLIMKDEDVVVKFKNFIKIDKRIDKINDTYYQLAFQDKEMAIDLVSLGLFNNKSLVLKPPKINDNLIPHFIRGYFDGDGGVSYNQKEDKLTYYFTGTLEIVEWIHSFLKTDAKIRKEHNAGENNTWRFATSGINMIKDLYNFIYTDSTQESRMDRKYSIITQYLNSKI